MSETSVITASRRTARGSRAVNRLRDEGKIPAVLYGHKEEVVSLVVEQAQIEALLRKGAHGLLEVDLGGAKESAVIKEMQWDVFGKRVLHVDFARVSKDEKIVVDVPIVLKGTAPGAAEGGSLDQPLHTIEIRCAAGAIQEQVVVNISGLHLGQAILVKDLELNEGAEAVADPDQVVVHVTRQAVEEEGEAAEVTAEPELIRREKAEEEEEKE